ncbi:MAG: undecaprenyldiphospho-muramoylpentapeptide beta-N-acetylglucosaminyltransferase [Candidatus Marinimicrobia bacterium]|nr:undecaprenyldiphospho-muramoylpentapeptide beta-N-acetylglucosaminyltransferase [Candidatus Neomarinimicrobiota bacterium]
MVEKNEPRILKILITGGGTGGHLFPAIALAEELQSRQAQIDKLEILFIGTSRGLEARVLPELGYNFRKIWIRGWQRGWTLRDILVNLLFPIRLLVSLIQSYFIIKNFNPDFAIGTGGYTAGPPLRIAATLKIPIFLHEQNVLPGATTKILASKAKQLYTSFAESKAYLENSVYFGTPLRRSLQMVSREQAAYFFELEPERKTIMIFGGSQGSQALNSYWAENIQNVIEAVECQFIWQTGQRDYELLDNVFSGNPYIHVTPFIHEMGIAYCAADVVISRAGALSLAELCLYGKPSLLVPLPTAAGNHQEANARNMEQAGASILVLQKELTTDLLTKELIELLKDEPRLQSMAEKAKALAKPDSARLIVDNILSFVELNVL